MDYGITIRPAYKAACWEAIQAQHVRMDETGLRGASAQVDIIANGAGYNTLGGVFTITSQDFRGRRNKPHAYTNLAGAMMAFRCLSADNRRMWHTNAAGARKLVIG